MAPHAAAMNNMQERIAGAGASMADPLMSLAMAAANSKGDAEGVGRGLVQAVTASFMVSGVLVVVLLSAPEHILGFFQTNAEVMPFAKTYCIIRALSLPAALSMNVCQAAFRSLLDLTTPFCVVMLANLANFVLDNVLMFQLGWGMAGCGWASVISQGPYDPEHLYLGQCGSSQGWYSNDGGSSGGQAGPGGVGAGVGHFLTSLFTQDVVVKAAVSSAALPATIMLGLAWNNALEGCLLAGSRSTSLAAMKSAKSAEQIEVRVEKPPDISRSSSKPKPTVRDRCRSFVLSGHFQGSLQVAAGVFGASLFTFVE
eukprot:gene6234-6471_t